MKKQTSLATRTIIATIVLGIAFPKLQGQDAQSYIFGTVFTKSDESYEGFMRWGKEEVFWHDVFNSTKTSDRSVKASSKKSGKWYDFDFDFSNIWENKYGGSSRQFACHFGDIGSLELKRNGTVLVGLKNDAVIEVRGGSNDIGTTIQMISPELGSIRLPWDRIERIEFGEAPTGYDSPYEQILYGTVQASRNRTYTGIVTWDLDERLSDDVLDGDSRQGEHEIPMGLIASIERLGDDASRIVMKSGKKLDLSGSNDVDDGNRGISVYDQNRNSIEIGWDDFMKVTFESTHHAATRYSDYEAPGGMYAVVKTFKGDRFEGRIAFDADEVWEVEFLDGSDDDIDYQIPFRNIGQIVPKNSTYSMITLRTGESVLLGDSQDVSGANDGILIFKDGSRDPERIEWDDVDELVFK